MPARQVGHHKPTAALIDNKTHRDQPGHASLPSTETSPGSWGTLILDGGLYSGCICGGICKSYQSCNPHCTCCTSCRWVGLQGRPSVLVGGGRVEGFGNRLLDCSMGLTGQLSEIWSMEWQ